MLIVAGDLLSCDQERLKNYVNVTCTIQKTRDTSSQEKNQKKTLIQEGTGIL